MIDVGILDGDLVIVKKQDDADHGEVVVAMLNQEATIKRLFRTRTPSGTRIELHSENPKYKPIVVSDQEMVNGALKIVGIFSGLIRLN
jgi:repressor LexA